MTHKLDIEKAIQAVGVLLRREGKKATRLRILKLLYIADRMALRDTGSPILGSNIVAMKHGPLHSEVYDLINGSHAREAEWSRHFSNEGKYVLLDLEPQVGKLSRHEIAILNKVVDDRVLDTEWEIVDETHSFAEWIKCYPDPLVTTSRPIPFEALLEAVGRKADAKAIEQDRTDTEFYNDFFSGVAK